MYSSLDRPTRSLTTRLRALRPASRGRSGLLSTTALATTALVLATSLMSSGAGAQEVDPGAGVSVSIPSLTFPNPIDGVRAAAAGAEVIGDGAAIARDGNNEIAVQASDGGLVDLTGGSVTTSEYGGVALNAVGTGHILADAVEIHTAVRAAHGAVASAGGQIDLTGGSITVDAGTLGNYPAGYTYGLYAVGAGSEITASGTAIATSQIWSFGVYATDGATIDVTGGTITTTGERGYGLLSEDGSSVTSTAVITTSGYKAHGAQAYKNSDGDEGGQLFLTGGSIATTGNESFGLSSNKAGSTITSSIDITTSGEGSYGFYADRNGSIALIGGSVTTTGSGSAAGAIVNGGTVTIEDTVLSSNAATLLVGFSEAGKTASVTFGEGAVATANNGVLIGVTRGVNGGDGVLEVVLGAGSTTAGNITDLDPRTTGGTDVLLESGASWSGQMQGVRNFVTEPGGEGSDVTFDGFVEIGGDLVGSNTNYLFSDEGGSIGGDVVLEEGSSTSGGTIENPVTIGGDVGVDETSTLGGNLDIGGDLDMAGTLNPGNSPGIINIGGNYNALPGATALFETDLTSSSPVAGVTYDQVNIGGNVSGSTTIYLQPLNASNATPLGDLGQIELVTVGGTVGADAFVQGNRVVQYGHDILLQGREEGGDFVLGLTSIVADESYVLASVPALTSTMGTLFLGSYTDRRGLDWSGQSATWARVVGGGFSLDEDAGVGLDATLVGTQVGVDLLALPFHGPDRGETRIGVTVGYGQVWSDVDRGDGGSAGSADGSQVAVGAYVTHAQQNLYADLLVQYRFLSYDLDAPQTSDMEVDGNALDVAFEVGAPLPVAESLVLVPSAQLVYQHIMLDGYSDANFDASYDDDDVLTGTLNLLAQGDFAGVRPYGSVGVSWDFLGDQSTEISGYGIDTDSADGQAQIGLGVEGTVAENFSLYLAGQYNIAFDGNQQIYVGKLGGRYQF